MKLIRIAYGEGYLSIIKRWLRALWSRCNQPKWEVNHFCPGDSGSGEWSRKPTDIPCKCGYCGKKLGK